MRKVLSFVLVLALVLGSFSMAFADYSDMAGEDSSEAVSVLSELGVVAGYPDGSFRPDQVVTRAEMARLIVASLGLEAYATGTTSKYPDMNQAPWAQGYVAYATSIGFISGYPDGTFKPNNPVSVEEACSMLVRALGYTEAFLPGGWPAEWMIKANSLGILDDISKVTGGANRGDIAQMIYNALALSIGQVNNENEWKAFIPADSMLDRLGAVAFAAVVIDGTEASAINLKPYVGAYASVYRDGATVADDIIAIKEVESTFYTGEFAAAVGAGGNILAGAKFTLTDDTEYSLKAAIGTATIEGFLNAASAGLGNAVAAGAECVIAAELSGTKITEIYSISVWAVDQNDQVSTTDLKAISASTPKLLSETFALDDNDDIDLDSFDLVGVASLDDIEKDDVVYVYSEAAGDISKIEVGNKEISGEVTRISGADYTVGGVVYEFTDVTVYNNAMAAGTRPSVGDEIEAALDVNGDIYFYEVITGEADKYAVVLRTVAGSNNGALNATDSKVELLLNDGTVKTFVVEEDSLDEIDATAGAGNDPLDDAAPVVWNVVTGDVVKYDVNADGEINAMTWVVDSSVKATAGVKATGGGDYKAGLDMTAKGYFNGLAVTSDATILTFDDSAGFTTDDDDYGVSSRADFLDTAIVEAWYVLKDNQIVFMYIDSASTSDDVVLGVLTSSAIVSSTAPKYEGKFLIDGEEVVLAVEENITTGHAKDELYVLTYAAGSTVVKQIDVITAADYDNRAVVTTAADITGDVLTATINGVAATKITLDDEVVVYSLNSDGKFEVAGISDIDGEASVVLYDIDDDMVYDIALIDGALVAITAPAIAGLTAPVTGVAPDTTVTAGIGYTATVTWAPADNPYLTTTVYTATITLTPTAGYTLTGVPANFFTVAGATSDTNPINSGVVTAVFPATL